MPHTCEPLRTDGKFFRAGAERVPLLGVTYGPFPDDYPTSADEDFARIAAAGFNVVRTYTLPGGELLDAALSHGLRVFAGLDWGYPADFRKRTALVTHALVKQANFLVEHGSHPALAGVYVANEIRSDLVRWMGPDFVRDVLEQLITEGRRAAPHLLFAYANYPSTEYLEPANADFTAFNIYLEKEEDYRAYLKRLHHIAGDRPLVISEFGLDTHRNSRENQAEVLRWGATISREEEAAGFTVYAWSDRWATGGEEILDWDFGMTDRSGAPKEVLLRWDASLFTRTDFPSSPSVSVIICTRNGIKRIEACLKAASRMTGGGIETIVVDDGSEDGTADLVAARFPDVRLLRLEPGGLSAARNAGASAANGEILAFTDDDCEPDIEWVARLRRVFRNGKFAAAGGPNLPPPPRDWREAVVCAAPGAPSHVMLTDQEAEHLPGCNIAVTKEAFKAVGGFDPQFHTAGDDVDFCWRLREAGYHLGFAAGAFVWHWRRPSFSAFFRQQLGYAKAERMLIAKHPGRFSKRGGARWEGFVYGGGPVRATRDSIIYHGPMGTAGYQHVMNRMLPLRGLDGDHDTVLNRLALELISFIQPRLRAWGRNHTIVLRSGAAEQHRAEDPTDEFGIQPNEGQDREYFLKFLVDRRWKPGGDTDEWDVEKNGTRVLLATEYRNHKPVILFRVWGPAEQLMLYMGVNRNRR
jgi:GT2 family glycosyltransferase